MTAENRNTEFLKHQGLINVVIKNNYPLLRKLHLELEDVEQDLSICLLEAIEKFDSNEADPISIYLLHSLQYEILNMMRKHKPHGITHYTQKENFYSKERGMAA